MKDLLGLDIPVEEFGGTFPKENSLGDPSISEHKIRVVHVRDEYEHDGIRPVCYAYCSCGLFTNVGRGDKWNVDVALEKHNLAILNARLSLTFKDITVRPEKVKG